METWPHPGGQLEQLLKAEGLPCPSKLEATTVLTVEHLEYFAMCAAASQLERPDGPYQEIVVFGTATNILRFFLGDEWTDDNLFGCHSDVLPRYKAGRLFLRTEPIEGDKLSFLLSHRALNLAECLFNFQKIAGVSQRRAVLKSSGLEAAYGELEGFKLISSPLLKPRFVAPTGRKGADYDAEFTAINGQIICCEIKTKQEHLEYRASTVRNTIESARKQLPKCKPGFVFLRVPDHWVKQVKIKEIVDLSIQSVLRQSCRLAAVVLVWEEWAYFGNSCAVAPKFAAQVNLRSEYRNMPIQETLALFGTRSNQSWISIDKYVIKNLPRLVELAKRYLPTLSQLLEQRQEATEDNEC